MYIPLMAGSVYHILVLDSKVVVSFKFEYGAVHFLDLCNNCFNYKGPLQNMGHIERLIESHSHT